jgi:hypothetical protein
MNGQNEGNKFELHFVLMKWSRDHVLTCSYMSVLTD